MKVLNKLSGNGFDVTGTKQQINNYLRWIKEYHHGTTVSGEDGKKVVCKNERDFFACRLKAKKEKIIS